jgi:hypothetical protein
MAGLRALAKPLPAPVEVMPRALRASDRLDDPVAACVRDVVVGDRYDIEAGRLTPSRSFGSPEKTVPLR